MHKKIIGISICISFFLIFIPIAESHSLEDTSGPPIFIDHKAVLRGRISGVEWGTYGSTGATMYLHAIFVVGYRRCIEENYHSIPIPFILIQRTVTIYHATDFQGDYTDEWISGTVYYQVGLDIP